MDQHLLDNKIQYSGISHVLREDPSIYFDKYRQLSSAVRLGQSQIIELLLEKGAPVNLHPVVCGYHHKLPTPLHASVHLGNPEIVNKLLARGASANALFYHDTPLTLSAKHQKYELTDLLLVSEGLKNHRLFYERISHFHLACMRNNIDVAKKLLQSKKDVNAAVNCDSDYWPGFTPLHFAVQFQCTEMVKFLLSIGADITMKDSRHLTPLHLAHMFRNVEIIDIILRSHDKVMSNPVSPKGLSHFHIACTRNIPEIVEYFIRSGVDLQSPLPNEPTYFGVNKTVIDLALHYECIDVVDLLLRSGVHLGVPWVDSVFDRIACAYRTGNTGMVDVLTADNRLNSISPMDDTSNLPLRQKFHDIGFMQALLTRTPNALESLVNHETKSTLLHVAIQYGSEEVCELLLRKGADFTAQDFRGKSPLHLAFERNMEAIMSMMLEDHNNYDRNPIDNDGLSHLHIACAENNLNTVVHLLRLGASVNEAVGFEALSWAGFTPLHFAAKFQNSRTTRILLDYGASYSILDAKKHSAFDIAYLEARSGRNELARILELILICHSQRQDASFNDRGISLLHLASGFIESPHPPIEKFIEVLEAHPNDVNKAIQGMKTLWDGYTPLHCAASPRFPARHSLLLSEQARLLIEKGADIMKPAANGDTPMHITTSLMLTADVPDSRLLHSNQMGSQGDTIFHRACKERNLGLMKYFLDHGVDPNYFSFDMSIGCDDLAPLHMVILGDEDMNSDSSVKAVKLLLDHHADPTLRDYSKNTPLHFMYSCHHSEIIDMLVDHGADVNSRNVLFETPLNSLCNRLFIAGEYMGKNAISFLRNGADINATNEVGQTPLSSEKWEKMFHADEPEYDDFVEYSPIMDALLTHIIKLETLGLYVSEINRKAYTYHRGRFLNELHFVQETYAAQCAQELNLLKSIRVGSYTSLYDILLESSNKLAVSSRNSAFQEIIDSNDFDEKYPLYGFLLKLRMKEGRTRWPLLCKSRKVLIRLLGIPLPQVCVDEILQHLDNRNLENLNKIYK